MNIFSTRLDCSEGGSGGRERTRGGRSEADASLCLPCPSVGPSLGSSTGDVCSFNSCCLPTNYKAEGGHFLPSLASEADENVTRVFAVFTTVWSPATIHRHESSCSRGRRGVKKNDKFKVRLSRIDLFWGYLQCVNVSVLWSNVVSSIFGHFECLTGTPLNSLW